MFESFNVERVGKKIVASWSVLYEINTMFYEVYLNGKLVKTVYANNPGGTSFQEYTEELEVSDASGHYVVSNPQFSAEFNFKDHNSGILLEG